MSASSKKKLRKEMTADLLTEKQKQEKKEAKKLKVQTISFVAIMLAIVILATSILAVRGVNQSGIIDRKTIAAVIDGKELNSVQMNYYLCDYIQNYYSQMESQFGTSTNMYLGFSGIDANKPLDKQVYNKETGETWGDHFASEALQKAKSDYALYNKAMAEGFTLTAEQQQTLDSNLSMISMYAAYSGYKNPDKYLQNRYGYGSTEKSYAEYSRISYIATAYYAKYSESLTYDDAAIRAYEKDKENDYTSISYNVYSVNSSSYLEGGTKGEDGNTTYTDAEKEAALKKAEEIANELAKSTDVAALDKAIAALEINKDKENVASTANTDVFYPEIPKALQSWLISKDRVENEMKVIAIESTTTDADGKETTSTTGYYVVAFQKRNENLRPLANVRHLLVQFEGGTTGIDGNKTYSDSEKATAKAEAERLLQLWKDGEATEDTFIAMVKEHSDDAGSKEEGGMIEDIHPQSALVTNFRNWSVDADRKVGDTAVIVSEYGYHVMFYSSDDELTYRDYMIREDMRADDVEAWYNGIVDASTATLGKTNRLHKDFVLANLSSSSSSTTTHQH